MRKEYRKLLSNTALLAIGSFASSILGMLLTPLYTSVLSTSDYGVFDLITTTTSLIYPFASIAISESIMRFALDKGVDKRSVYTIGLTIVSLGFVLILCATPIIRRSTIGEYTGLFLLYYIVHCIHTITSYFVKGLEKVSLYSVSGLLNSIIVIICNLLFLLVFDMGIAGYLLAFILGHLSTIIFRFFAAKLYRYITVPWQVDRDLLGRMIKYSVPIIPNSISWWIANSSDKYMLNYYADVSQVGIYAISYKIPTIMMTVMGFFTSAWQLSAVENFGTERSKQFFSDVYSKCVAVNVLLAAGLIAFSKIFGRFLYSADFFIAWKFVPVLIIANVFNVLATFMGTVYTSAKKTKMLAVSTLIGAGSNIVMNLLLIPRLGTMGAAIATAGSYFIIWTVRVINTRKIMTFAINYTRDIFFFSLLVVDAILVSIDKLPCQILSFIILGFMLVFNRAFLIDIIMQIFSGITSKFRKRK